MIEGEIDVEPWVSEQDMTEILGRALKGSSARIANSFSFFPHATLGRNCDKKILLYCSCCG